MMYVFVCPFLEYPLLPWNRLQEPKRYSKGIRLYNFALTCLDIEKNKKSIRMYETKYIYTRGSGEKYCIFTKRLLCLNKKKNGGDCRGHTKNSCFNVRPQTYLVFGSVPLNKQKSIPNTDQIIFFFLSNIFIKWEFRTVAHPPHSCIIPFFLPFSF